MIFNDLEIVKGDTPEFTITFKDKNGDAIDITGWTIYFTVKEKATDDDVDATFQDTFTLSDPTNGIARITLANSDTQNITAKVYEYDIQYIKNTGEIGTPIIGQFNLIEDITDATT